MNVELAVKALLDAAGRVTALVPAVRIYAGRLPQNVAYPALLINTIASSPIDSYPASGTDARIEVRAFSRTRSEVKAVLDAVGPALKRQWGSFGGISVADKLERWRRGQDIAQFSAADEGARRFPQFVKPSPPLASYLKV